MGKDLDEATATILRLRGQHERCFKRLTGVKTEGELSDLAFHVGQWVAASLLLQRRARDKSLHAERLANGEFGEQARPRVENAWQYEVEEEKLVALIAEREKNFKYATTSLRHWDTSRYLIVLKIRLALVRGDAMQLDDFLPVKFRAQVERHEPKKKSRAKDSPSACDNAAESEAPLTLAEALFRDQLDYRRREEERGRAAFERRKAFELAAAALQTERAAGTYADVMTMLKRNSDAKCAVLKRATAELDALNASEDQTALTAMLALREAVNA